MTTTQKKAPSGKRSKKTIASPTKSSPKVKVTIKKPRSNKSAPIAGKEASTSTLLLPPSLKGRPLPTLILDTGGWTIKHGVISPKGIDQNVSSSNTTLPNNTTTSIVETIKPNQSSNVIAKPKHVLTTLISNEINTIQNKANLIVKRPLERGYTTDLGVQFQIWDYVLNNENLECRHSFSNGGVKGGVLMQNQSTFGGMNSQGKKSGDVSCTSSRMSPVPGGCIYTHTAAVFCLHQPFTPRNILEKEDEIWFRDFGFGRVHRVLGVCCTAFRYLMLAKMMRKELMLIEDSTDMNEHEAKEQQLRDKYGFVVNDDKTGCCCVIDSGFSLTHVVPTVDGRAIVS